MTSQGSPIPYYRERAVVAHYAREEMGRIDDPHGNMLAANGEYVQCWTALSEDTKNEWRMRFRIFDIEREQRRVAGVVYGITATIASWEVATLANVALLKAYLGMDEKVALVLVSPHTLQIDTSHIRVGNSWDAMLRIRDLGCVVYRTGPGNTIEMTDAGPFIVTDMSRNTITTIQADDDGKIVARVEIGQ